MFDTHYLGLLQPPAPDALTEVLRANVPLDLKSAVAEAARRSGTSLSGFIRETLADRVAREAVPKTSIKAARDRGCYGA